MNRRLALAGGAGVLAATVVAASLVVISSPAHHVEDGDAAVAVDLEASTPAEASFERSPSVDLDAAADANADAETSKDAASSTPTSDDPRCRLLAAETSRVGARIAAADPTCGVTGSTLLEAFGHCEATAAGAWSLVARRFEVRRAPAEDDGKTCAEIDVEVGLVHVGPLVDAGKLSRSERVPFAHAADGGIAANWGIVFGSEGHILDQPVFVDYDGDGELEVIVSSVDSSEGYDPSQHELDTFASADADAAARVEPYPPARAILFDGVADVDHDGRPDLLTRGPYSSLMTSDALGDEVPLAPAMFVQHSRSDGSFSPRDDAALAALQATCARARPLREATFPVEDVVRDLICARLHGVSPAAVRAQLLPACPALCQDSAACDRDAGDVCPRWVAEVLDVPPFVRLR